MTAASRASSCGVPNRMFCRTVAFRIQGTCGAYETRPRSTFSGSAAAGSAGSMNISPIMAASRLLLPLAQAPTTAHRLPRAMRRSTLRSRHASAPLPHVKFALRSVTASAPSQSSSPAACTTASRAAASSMDSKNAPSRRNATTPSETALAAIGTIVSVRTARRRRSSSQRISE